jgi:uncharacterized protein (TIGR03435 family)
MWVASYGRMNMTAIANSFAMHASRPVIDGTGLEGPFDLELEFMPELAHFPPVPSTTEVQTSPSLFTALREQAGLRLESRRAPVEVLVIDAVERPTDH